MRTREPVRFRFWADIVPVATAWTIAMLLMAAGLVLIIGIYTAPLGLLLILWAGRIAGKSFVKHWSRAYDRRLAEQRNTGC